MERLFTTAELGRLIGNRSADWVRREIAAGEFPGAAKDGGEWLIPEPAAEAWVKTRTVAITRAEERRPVDQVTGFFEWRRRNKQAS